MTTGYIPSVLKNEANVRNQQQQQQQQHAHERSTTLLLRSGKLSDSEGVPCRGTEPGCHRTIKTKHYCIFPTEELASDTRPTSPKMCSSATRSRTLDAASRLDFEAYNSPQILLPGTTGCAKHLLNQSRGIFVSKRRKGIC